MYRQILRTNKERKIVSLIMFLLLLANTVCAWGTVSTYTLKDSVFGSVCLQTEKKSTNTQRESIMGVVKPEAQSN